MEVAVGIVKDKQGRVLIGKRPPGSYMEGFWEFPGGKVEEGETVAEALSRELKEETGLTTYSSRPLITYHFRYPDRGVHLHAHLVTDYEGKAEGCEGQELMWAPVEQFHEYDMLEANLPIIHALALPRVYWITDELSIAEDDFWQRLSRMLDSGVKLVRFRSHSLDDATYEKHARRLIEASHARGAEVMLDRNPDMSLALNADGHHLTRHALMRLAARKFPEDKWLSASCHNEEEVKQANRIGTDFITLSPIDSTPSHPEALPLGWFGFVALVDIAKCPVYALGGLTPNDLETALSHGAQGISGIRGITEIPTEMATW